MFKRPLQSNTPTSSDNKPSDNAAANRDKHLPKSATKVEGPDGMAFWTSKKDKK